MTGHRSPAQVMIVTPNEKGSSIEVSDKEYQTFEDCAAAAAFVDQYNQDNRHNASRAYMGDEVQPKGEGMAASLINTINAGIESGSEFIFIDGKGDMDSMRQTIDKAQRRFD